MITWLRRHLLPPARTTKIIKAIANLKALEPKGDTAMSNPTGYVQILQSDLDTFASEITAAVAVIGPYIQDLLQGNTLAPGEESDLIKAVTALEALEPPAPTPGS